MRDTFIRRSCVVRNSRGRFKTSQTTRVAFFLSRVGRQTVRRPADATSYLLFSISAVSRVRINWFVAATPHRSSRQPHRPPEMAVPTSYRAVQRARLDGQSGTRRNCWAGYVRWTATKAEARITYVSLLAARSAVQVRGSANPPLCLSHTLSLSDAVPISQSITPGDASSRFPRLLTCSSALSRYCGI